MSNTKNKPKADGLFCKRCKATSGVLFRGLCGNCWVERAEMAEKLEQALERAVEYLAEFTGSCPMDSELEFDDDICAEGCKSDTAACWKRYFLEKGADKDDDH